MGESRCKYAAICRRLQRFAGSCVFGEYVLPRNQVTCESRLSIAVDRFCALRRPMVSACPDSQAGNLCGFPGDGWLHSVVGNEPLRSFQPIKLNPPRKAFITNTTTVPPARKLVGSDRVLSFIPLLHTDAMKKLTFPLTVSYILAILGCAGVNGPSRPHRLGRWIVGNDARERLKLIAGRCSTGIRRYCRLL